jgi:hypothetical protein
MKTAPVELRTFLIVMVRSAAWERAAERRTRVTKRVMGPE